MATREKQKTFVDWDEVEDFTPELYDEYCSAPLWERDSMEFSSPEDYHNYWFAQTKQLLISSKDKIGKWQESARSTIEALERGTDSSAGVSDMASALASQPIPFAAAQIDERVALLSTNPPQPIAVALQEKEIPYVNAINSIINMELEANNYETIVYGCHYDEEFYNCSIIKTTVNRFEKGPFGQEGRIFIEQADPSTIYFDPLAKKLHWNYMDYVIQLHQMEIGEIQSQYPYSAKYINPEASELFAASIEDIRSKEDYIQSPQPKLAKGAGSKRQKIQVAELWIKDSRKKFEPFANPAATGYEDRFKTDEDGYLLGNWVPRYPDGRLVVVCGGRVLRDIANPYAHGQAPFIFIQSAPRKKPATLGNAPKIMVVTRKINDILKYVHTYAQSEIPRPMHADAGAILNPELADKVPNDPRIIVDLAPGKQLVRPQPSDIPAFTFPYLQSLQAALDLVSGSSAVMRGNISDGAQLSAEALASLQQYASSRLALSAKYFNQGIKQLGYQLMWLIRQHYDQKITVPVTMPDGSQTMFDWESDRKIFETGDPTEISDLRKKEDYQIVIKAGTGNPGGPKQQGPMLELFRENAIDREALLDALEFPGRQFVNQRMRNNELENIKAKAEAHELGVNVGEELRQNRPGRRKKD